MNIETLAELLLCPHCSTPPELAQDRFACGGCGRSYPIVDGVPEMLDEEQRARLVALREAWGGQKVGGQANPGLVALVKRFVPPGAPFLNLASARNLARIDADLARRGPEALLLDLGSGAGEGAGMSRVDPALLRDRTVFLDVGAFPGVNVVGDGEHVPLADARFDAVLLKAVLEHVPSASRVLAEVSRVLKPGGIVYAEIPFLYEYHPNPGDYVRFTRMGLEQLFADFDDVEVGTLVGPAAALASLTAQCLALACSFGHLGLRKALLPFFTWITWPLSLPDLWLTRMADAHVAAHHLYVIARRRESCSS